MKNIFKILTLSLFLGLYACGSDNGKEEEQKEQEEGTFNIWVSLGSWPDTASFIANVESVEEGTLDLVGKGVEGTSTFIDYGVVVKGEYYYAVSVDGRFGKYKITTDELVVEQEIPLDIFSKSYSIDPTWIDDTTLFLGGANGEHSAALYAVINTADMTITSSGTISGIEFPEGFPSLWTGTPAYVEGKLYYGLNFRNDDWETSPGMKISVINTTTFEVETTIEDSRTGSFGNSWGGGNYEPYSFRDENNDLYFCTWTTNDYCGDCSTTDRGDNMVLRINNGDTEIDPSYIGYQDEIERIRGMWYLGNGEALVKIYNPTLYDRDAGQIYPENFGILNVYTGVLTELNSPQHKWGTTQNTCVDTENGKAYVIIEQEIGDSHIWVYDITTGSFTEGMTLPSGYNGFTRLDFMKAN